MRLLLLATLTVVPLAARAAVPELELAPGVAVSNDASQAAPSVRARMGVRFPWFTPSLVVFGAATSTPGPKSHNRQDGGLQAWAFAAEVAVHNDGANQLSAAFGAGVGRLIVAQQSDGDYSTYAGEVAPCVEATLGYRHLFERFTVGIEGTLQVFNRVTYFSDVGTDRNGRLYLGGSPIIGVAVSFGFDL